MDKKEIVNITHQPINNYIKEVNNLIYDESLINKPLIDKDLYLRYKIEKAIKIMMSEDAP